MTDIPCLKHDTYADVHDSGYGVGAFAWGKRKGFPGRVLFIWLPDGVFSILVGHRLNVGEWEGEPVWMWDGNESSPTLSPSIDNSEFGGWHGFVRRGRLQDR